MFGKEYVPFYILLLLIFPASHSQAAPPEGVAFFPELFGYHGGIYQAFLDRYIWSASMDVDTDGDLWACSSGHTFEYHDRVWIDHTEASSGGDEISITSQGIVWITVSGGLASYDGQTWTVHSENMPGDIEAISAEGDDVWMACQDETHSYFLAHYNGGKVSTFSEGLLQDYIGRLTATPDGVWLVYNNSHDHFDCVTDYTTGYTNCPRGTSFFDGTTFHHYSIDNGLPKAGNDRGNTDVPWVVYSPHDGKTYVVCNGRLLLFSGGQWSDISSASSTECLTIDQQGVPWFGWLGGHGAYTANPATLYYLEENEWLSFNMSLVKKWLYEELCDSSEYSMQITSNFAITPDGYAWFCISSGIVRIEIAKLDLHQVGVEEAMPQMEASRVICYPNPFNNTTTLQFDLSETAKVEADIYSINGQLVTHISTGWLAAGSHALLWDGRNAFGEQVSSGMYFVRISAGDKSLIGSMTFVK